MKWLEANKIPFQTLPIRETPPTLSELNAMLKSRKNELRSLFNTSGQDYRAQDLKNKLPQLSQQDALTLLTQKGSLVKRPFALDEKAGIFLVGFRETEWQKAFKL